MEKEKAIEVLSWSWGTVNLGAGEPEFYGSVTADGFKVTFQDARNPAVGEAIINNFIHRRADQLTADIYYSDDGSASIDYVLADGTGGNIPIDDANFNDIRSGLANVVDGGDITPITIVPTDADFII